MFDLGCEENWMVMGVETKLIQWSVLMFVLDP